MKILTILLFVILISLSCAQPQKFEPNLSIEPSKTIQNVSQTAATSTDALTFVISEKNGVFFKTNLLGKVSETEQLQLKFSEMFKVKENKTVFLKVSHSIKYGDVEKIIDLLKAAGAEPIGLQID